MGLEGPLSYAKRSPRASGQDQPRGRLNTKPRRLTLNLDQLMWAGQVRLGCFRVVGNRVAHFVENSDDFVDRHLFVVELDGHRVLVHVGVDGPDVGDLLDGLTGLRRGTPSHDSRRL